MTNKTLYINKWLIDWEQIMKWMEGQKMMFMGMNFPQEQADAIMRIVDWDRRQNEFQIIPIEIDEGVEHINTYSVTDF